MSHFGNPYSIGLKNCKTGNRAGTYIGRISHGAFVCCVGKTLYIKEDEDMLKITFERYAKYLTHLGEKE